MRSHQKNPQPHKMAGTLGEALDAIQDSLDQLTASVVALTAAAASTSTSTSSGGTTTVASRPTQYSTADGSLSGTIDGVNVTFPLPAAATVVAVYRNGLLMTQGASGDYTIAGSNIVFTASQTPQPG